MATSFLKTDLFLSALLVIIVATACSAAQAPSRAPGVSPSAAPMPAPTHARAPTPASHVAPTPTLTPAGAPSPGAAADQNPTNRSNDGYLAAKASLGGTVVAFGLVAVGFM